MNANNSTPSIFSYLLQLISSAEKEGYSSVNDDIDFLYSQCISNMEKDSANFLCTLLLNAYINKKSSHTQDENIYLKNYEVSQIRLFDILIEKLPYVKYSQAITNQQIVQMLSNYEEASLFDIGIGLGTQVVNVLKMAAANTSLKKLVIIGVEPSAEALEKAKINILAMKDTVPFDIEFKAFTGFAEEMDLPEIDFGTNNIIVNASLALHHIQSNEKRNQVIEQVRQLNPTGFFLIEPNVDHFEPDLVLRIQNCFQHFYNLFRTIDRLDILHAEQNALKLFFGREIEDIIGKSEEKRFEKHEPATHWLQRMQEAGFESKSHLLHTPINIEAGVQISHHAEGFVGFTYQDETILSIIYAA